VGLVRGTLTSLERATCGALVVIDVHARDVVADMAARKVEDVRDFNWCERRACSVPHVSVEARR
jgi:dynein heavy chain, axonemal